MKAISKESQNPDFSLVAKCWEKWEDWLEPCYQSFNERMLQAAGIAVGKMVLDLGCGTGQPALLEAQRVGPGGKVIALDVLPEMLAVASKRAVVMNLTNIEFRQCDIELIPFPDAAFDAATSRFCLMFLRSVEKSVSEVYRVLKPGSGFCASVWAAPEKNPLPRGVLSAYYSLPAPDRSVPGPFRFSEKGSLKELVENAGFVDVTEREVELRESFVDGAQYLEHILEASALWGSLLRKLDKAQFAEATESLVAAAEKFRSGNRIVVPRIAWLVAGRKG